MSKANDEMIQRLIEEIQTINKKVDGLISVNKMRANSEYGKRIKAEEDSLDADGRGKHLGGTGVVYGFDINSAYPAAIANSGVAKVGGSVSGRNEKVDKTVVIELTDDMLHYLRYYDGQIAGDIYQVEVL